MSFILENFSVPVLAGGLTSYLLILLLSWQDEYLSERQLPSTTGSYANAYSALQHGGLWADLLILTPLLAWIGTHTPSTLLPD